MYLSTTTPTVHQPDDTSTDFRSPDENLQSANSRQELSGASRRFLWALLLTIGLLASATLEANPIYVSPNGNDGAPGTEAQPFRTVERAREAARAAAPHAGEDVTVYLRNGRYKIGNTLKFDGRDSGQHGRKVIYRSYPGERAAISGGAQITGWSHYRDGIYKAHSPVAAYRQLYINGKPGTRARTPNHSFNRVSHWNGDRTITIPADQISHWSNLNQVEMVVMKHWNQSRLRIGSFHKSGNSATIVPMEPERTVEWLVAWPNREANQPYYFENSLDFLDEPGEWYLDRNSQTVYYMPRPGESMNTTEVIAPRLERLVDIRGAANLHFEGLTFEHSTWNDPSHEGFIGIQASSLRVLTTGELIPSAIYLENTQHVRFERNLIHNLGTNGLELAFGTYQTEIIGNVFTDLGGGGVLAYTFLGDRYPPEHRRSRGDKIRNNYITRIGQHFTGAVGIFASYTDGVVIEHNELYDLPYTAINVGWGWDHNDTATRNNLVRYNRIHNVMNLMDDGAGIYTLSKQPGTLIEENHISNIVRNSWAGYYEISGLYLDEQSEGITMRNNVVQQLSGASVWKQNRANANNVYNNGEGIANQQAIINNAGLEPSYQNIRDIVSNPIAESPSQGPYPVDSAAIPGRIQAENYDHGGPGVAYQDTVNFNQGGQHRLSEQVDIENTGDTDGGYNLGFIEPGEWLHYSVDIEATGHYDFRFRTSSIYNDRHFRILVDGRDLSGPIAIPNTGNWQTWETISVSGINLDAGKHTLRLQFDTGGLNLNWFEAEANMTTPPSVSIASPTSGSKFPQKKVLAIDAAAAVESGSIVRVEFFAGDQKIGERTTAPFTFSWLPSAEGPHHLTARATSDTGDTSISDAVEIEILTPVPQKPFNDQPTTIPGTIKMVEFDHGGPGVAYHDTTPANLGSAFRPDEAVDIESSSGESFSHNIGWVEAGEWINYSVNVVESGTYHLNFRVASELNGGHFHLQMDEKDITDRIDVPNTGNWQEWRTISVSNLSLKSGNQTLRLRIGSGQFNIGSTEFVRVAEQSSMAFTYWQEGHFSPQERNSAQLSGPTADPDGDGIVNLLEYAFNRNPRAASRQNLPEPGSMRIEGAEFMTYTYTRTSGATDLEFIVEASPNMKTWQSEGLIPVSVTREGEVEKVTVRDALPLGQSPNQFMRLRVKKTTS